MEIETAVVLLIFLNSQLLIENKHCLNDRMPDFLAKGSKVADSENARLLISFIPLE